MMKKVTVMGMYIKKDDPIGDSDGGTAYGNLLNYPGVLSRKKQIVPALSVLWG